MNEEELNEVRFLFEQLSEEAQIAIIELTRSLLSDSQSSSVRQATTE